MRRTPVWRLTASGLTLVAVCYGLARFAYGLFVPDFRAAFALSDTLLGTVAAGSYVGYCVAVVCSAAAVSRFGARATAVAAGVLAASGMVMIALSVDAAMLATGVLIAGASTGVASPPLAEAIARRVPGRSHDRVQALVNAGPGAGIAASGLIALFASHGWRVAWILFATIAVVVTLLVACSVPALPSAHRDTGTGRGFAAVMVTPSSWRMAAAAALFGAASAAVWTFGRDHVTQASGLGHTGAMLWVVLGIAELGGLGAADFIGRWGLRKVWTINLVLIGATTATLGFRPAILPVVFLMISVFGTSYIVLTTVVFLWATRLFPNDTAASVAFGFLVIAAGQAITSPLVGTIADHLGTTAGFLVCAGIGVVAAVVLTPPEVIDKYDAGKPRFSKTACRDDPRPRASLFED